MTVFWRDRGGAAPLRKEQMDLRSRRVNSTHARTERCTRTSEISTCGEVEFLWGLPVWNCGFAGRGFDTRRNLFLRLPTSPFRGCCELGFRFLKLGLLPFASPCRLLRIHRDRLRRGLGCGLLCGVVVTLSVHPLGRCVCSPSPRSICSAEGLACWAFGEASWPVTTLFRLRSGASFARANLAFFHFKQVR